MPTFLGRDPSCRVILNHLAKKIYAIGAERWQSLFQRLAMPLWKRGLPVLESRDPWPQCLVRCSSQTEYPEKLINLRVTLVSFRSPAGRRQIDKSKRYVELVVLFFSHERKNNKAIWYEDKGCITWKERLF